MKRSGNSMVFAILCCLFLLSSALTTAQESSSDKSEWKIEIDPASKARIEFINDFWDFGSIPIESVVKYDFVFKNVGSDTLLITRVKTTCGCTTAPLSSDRVAPGETAEISASLNTKKLKGTIKKSILIDCNDPINPYLKLTIKARINDTLATIQSNPQVADFGEFKGSEKAKLSLDIANRSENPINLVIPNRPPDDILRVSLENNALAPGGSTIMKLEFMTKLTPGPFVSSLALEAEGESGSRISVPIQGTVIE